MHGAIPAVAALIVVAYIRHERRLNALTRPSSPPPPGDHGFADRWLATTRRTPAEPPQHGPGYAAGFADGYAESIGVHRVTNLLPAPVAQLDDYRRGGTR